MRAPRPSVFAASLLALFLGHAAAARALDQPISGAKLQLVDKGTGKEKLLFVSKDPAFPFPAIGGSDDPQVVGAVVEIVPQPVSEGGALTIPSGVGKPGWRTKPGSHPSLIFDNNQAPDGIAGVRTLLLRQGKQVLIRNGFDLAMPTLPFTKAPSVRVQLQSSSGRCWEGEFSRAKKNGPGLFIGQSD